MSADCKHCAELQAAYDDFQTQSKEFEAELEAELQAANEQVDQLKTKLDKSRADLAAERESSKSSQTSLHAQIASLQSELTKQTALVESLKTSKRQLELSIGTFETKLRRAEAEATDATERADAATEQLVLLKQDVHDQLTAHQEYEQRTRQELKEMKEELQYAKRQTETIAASASTTTSTTTTNSVPTPAPTTATDSSAEVARLQEELQLLQEEKTALNQDIEEVTTDLTRAQDENETLTKQVEELQQQLANQANATATAAPVASVPPTASAPTSLPSDLELIASLQTQLTNAQSSHQQQQHDQQIQHQQALAESKSTLQATIDAMQKEHDSLQAQLKESNEQHQSAMAALQQELLSIKSKLTDSTTSLTLVQSDLTTKQTELLTKQSELTTLQLELESLRQQPSSASTSGDESQTSELTDLRVKLALSEARVDELLQQQQSSSGSSSSAASVSSPTTHSFELDQLQQELRASQSLVITSQTQLAMIENEMYQVKDELELSKEEGTRKEEEITRLQNELKAAQHELTTVQEQLKSNQPVTPSQPTEATTTSTTATVDASSTATIASLEAELATHAASEKDLRRQLLEQSTLTASQSTQLIDLQSQLTQLTQTNTDLRQTVLLKTTDLTVSEATSQELQTQLLELQKKADSLNQQLISHSNTPNEQLAELQSQLANSHQATTKLESQLAELNTKLTTLNQQHASLVKENEQFKQDHKSITTKRDELEAQLVEVKKQHEATSKQLATVTSELTAFQSSDLDVQLTQSQKEVIRLKTQLTEAQAALSTQTAAYDKLAGESLAFELQIPSLHQQIEDLTETTTQLTQQLQAARNQVTEAQQTHATQLQEARVTHEAAVRELTSKLQAAEATQSQSSSADDTNSTLASAQIRALELAVVEAEKQCETLIEELHQSKAQVEVLTAQLLDAQTKTIQHPYIDTNLSDDLSQQSTPAIDLRLNTPDETEHLNRSASAKSLAKSSRQSSTVSVTDEELETLRSQLAESQLLRVDAEERLRELEEQQQQHQSASEIALEAATTGAELFDLREEVASLREQLAAKDAELQILLASPPPSTSPVANPKVNGINRHDPVDETSTSLASFPSPSLASSSPALYSTSPPTINLSSFSLSQAPADSSAIQQLHSQLTKDVENLQTEMTKYDLTLMTAIQPVVDSLQSDLTSSFQLMSTLQSNLTASTDRELDLITRLQTMKGHTIRVYCRVRPLLQHELNDRSEENLLQYPNEQQIAIRSDVAKRNRMGLTSPSLDDSTEDGAYQLASYTPYTFDKVFLPETTQEQVYEAVEDIILPVLNGFRACVFAYGQTGSGKTYTIEGNMNDELELSDLEQSKNLGITFRSFQTLFRGITNRGSAYHYELRMSVLELYNEQWSDLLDGATAGQMVSEEEIGATDADETNSQMTEEESLDGNKSKLKLTVRKGIHGMYCENASRRIVTNMSEVLALLQHASNSRRTESTNLNETSSRSHLLLLVDVIGINQQTQITTYGRLSLVDLAGSERVKASGSTTGIRLLEATHINRSLSALADVFQALADTKSKHIPFRNSKLTYLLQDSFVGNSKTLMFVNVSPASVHAGETLCSLQFAVRAKQVKLNRFGGGANMDGYGAKYKQMLETQQTTFAQKEKDYQQQIKQLKALLKAREKTLETLQGQTKTLQDRLTDAERRYDRSESERLKTLASLKQVGSMPGGTKDRKTELEEDKKWNLLHAELHQQQMRTLEYKTTLNRVQNEWKEKYAILDGRNHELTEKLKLQKLGRYDDDGNEVGESIIQKQTKQIALLELEVKRLKITRNAAMYSNKTVAAASVKSPKTTPRPSLQAPINIHVTNTSPRQVTLGDATLESDSIASTSVAPPRTPTLSPASPSPVATSPARSSTPATSTSRPSYPDSTVSPGSSSALLAAKNAALQAQRRAQQNKAAAAASENGETQVEEEVAAKPRPSQIAVPSKSAIPTTATVPVRSSTTAAAAPTHRKTTSRELDSSKLKSVSRIGRPSVSTSSSVHVSPTLTSSAPAHLELDQLSLDDHPQTPVSPPTSGRRSSNLAIPLRSSSSTSASVKGHAKTSSFGTSLSSSARPTSVTAKTTSIAAPSATTGRRSSLVPSATPTTTAPTLSLRPSGLVKPMKVSSKPTSIIPVSLSSAVSNFHDLLAPTNGHSTPSPLSSSIGSSTSIPPSNSSMTSRLRPPTAVNLASAPAKK